MFNRTKFNRQRFNTEYYIFGNNTSSISVSTSSKITLIKLGMFQSSCITSENVLGIRCKVGESFSQISVFDKYASANLAMIGISVEEIFVGSTSKSCVPRYGTSYSPLCSVSDLVSGIRCRVGNSSVNIIALTEGSGQLNKLGISTEIISVNENLKAVLEIMSGKTSSDIIINSEFKGSLLFFANSNLIISVEESTSGILYKLAEVISNIEILQNTKSQIQALGKSDSIIEVLISAESKIYRVLIFDLERAFKQLHFVINEIKPTVNIKERI